MAKSNILIYVLRHDLRLADNPVFHKLATHGDHGFTHLLPVYIFPAQQFEVSGFLKPGSSSPYPEARSAVSKVWRTGPHRAKFITQSVWDLKQSLESVGSGLVIRVGLVADVVKVLLDGFRDRQDNVGAVWMTGEEGVEERRDQRAVSALCKKLGTDFKLWSDEKYYVDDRDVTTPISEIPDVFTTYRKSIEPLRSRPRATLAKPASGKLPPMVETSHTPDQHGPFAIPTTYDDLEDAVLSPVRNFITGIPPYPDGAESAHPFQGGETAGNERLRHLIKTGLMYSYKETRNGMIGSAFSTKLSAFLAQGCVTARQVHHELLKYEDGTDPDYKDATGYGNGENDGTSAVRFELLWRDYMRLCTMKFGARLFRIEGFRDHDYDGEGEGSAKRPKWKSSVKEDALPEQKPSPDEVAKIIQRFNTGTTGMGLIDASQRELLHTGYTSNRARQNVASFLTKHLGIDWRFGAEWYEMMLVDYDVSSNWANWQYVAGVGNDPRGEARIFNPVKQAFDYDKEGTYVKTWVQEVKPLEKLENVFQVSTTSAEELEKAGLTDSIMVTDPVKRIEFLVDGKPKNNKRPFHRARGSRRPPSAGAFDSNGRPIHQSNGPAGPGSSDGGPGHRGAPHRGRGGGYNNGGPRRGFYSGRGRGQYAVPNYGPGYFGGPPLNGQMGSFGRGAYHNMAVRGGFQGGYPAPYHTGPPS
ncbi:hypothetical protein KVR01_002275 [Diaporthe batatas]|uniref:uncharacterized protein n=1 Tax=Diaporthe batatas TaxID=748121 RepID=UPI001D04FE06|nr:uncharacterized protein KVR01_002275 [Diaporthe batatas]KAG8166586.1 hypothetical protein KVR01_002275 [Diaporthe batatas]